MDTATPSATTEDHALAAQLAAVAGRLLAVLHADPTLSGAALGAAGDLLAHGYLSRALQQARPDDGFLSEECAPDPARLSKRRVWIVDPLDGTREFSESSARRSDWAVHVALTMDGRAEACAVALPALGIVFDTAQPRTLPPPPFGRMKIAVSRTRAPQIAHQVAQALDAELLPMGSAGAKAMAVLRGEVHAYLHAGGLSEWDSCAPVGVAQAAGLHASRIDGSPCVYNSGSVSMPDLLICRPECAEALLAAIAEHAPTTPR